MGRRIRENGGGGTEDPRGADGIPARLGRGRPLDNCGIDIGYNDRNRIVAIAADVKGTQLLGKVAERGRLDLPKALRALYGWAVTVFK